MWDIMEKHFNSGIPIDMDQFSTLFLVQLSKWLSYVPEWIVDSKQNITVTYASCNSL